MEAVGTGSCVQEICKRKDRKSDGFGLVCSLWGVRRAQRGRCAARRRRDPGRTKPGCRTHVPTFHSGDGQAVGMGKRLKSELQLSPGATAEVQVRRVRKLRGGFPSSGGSPVALLAQRQHPDAHPCPLTTTTPTTHASTHIYSLCHQRQSLLWVSFSCPRLLTAGATLGPAGEGS